MFLYLVLLLIAAVVGAPLNRQLVLNMPFDNSIEDTTLLNTVETAAVGSRFGAGATPYTGTAWLCDRHVNEADYWHVRATAKADDTGLNALLTCEEEGDATCSHTVSFWIKLLNATEGRFATVGISSGSDIVANTHRFMLNGGTFDMGVWNDGGHISYSVPSTVAMKDNWVFVTSVVTHWKGVSHTMKAYTGWLDGRMPIAPVSTPNYAPATTATYICGLTGFNWLTQAWIDQFRVHSRGLLDSEVFDLINHDLHCGDGTCDLIYGETPDSCPADCGMYHPKMFLTRDLVLHWPFDNATGLYTPDISPVGSTGRMTTSGSCSISTTSVSPSLGNSIHFTSTGRVVAEPPTNFTFNGFGRPVPARGYWQMSFTISVWFRADTLPAQGTNNAIAGIGQYDGTNYQNVPYLVLIQNSAGEGKLKFNTLLWEADVIDGEYTISTGIWYHVVLRRDSMVDVILNNNTIFSKQRWTNSRDSTAPWKSFAIAGYYASTASKFLGFMDDVRLYKRSLSDSEISMLYSCKDEPDGCRGPYITHDRVRCGDGVWTTPVEDCDGTLGCNSQCKCKDRYRATSTGTCEAEACAAYTNSTECLATTDSLNCAWCSEWNLCASSCITPAASNVVVVNTGTALQCSYTITTIDPDETDDSLIYWRTMGSTAEVPGTAIRPLPGAGEWATCSVIPRDSRGITGTKVSATNAEGRGIARVTFSNKIDDRNAVLTPYKQSVLMSASTAQGCSYFGSTTEYAVLSSSDMNDKAKLLASRLANVSNCNVFLGVKWDTTESAYKWLETGKIIQVADIDYFFKGGVLPDVATLGKHCVCIDPEGYWAAASCAVDGSVPLPRLCDQQILQQDITITSLDAEWSSPLKWTDASAMCNNKWHEPMTTQQLNHVAAMLQGSPYSAVWIGALWNTATSAWAFKSGAPLPSPIPWGPSEPKDGTAFPYVGMNNAGQWITFSAMTVLPYLCETDLAVMTAKTAYLFKLTPSSSSSSAYLLNMTELGGSTEKFNLSVAADIATLPGHIYALSVLNSNEGLTSPQGLSYTKGTCDCKNAFANDGKPTITLTQKNDQIEVAWSFNSRCESSALLTLDADDYSTVGTDPTCKLSTKSMVEVDKDTGDTSEICVVAYHSTTGYRAARSCKTYDVAWQSTVTGYIRVKLGVTSSYMSGVYLDWWMEDAPEVNGTVGPTGTNGAFSIAISSTDTHLMAATHTVFVRPRYTAFGTDHIFELDGCTDDCVDNVTLAAPIIAPQYSTKGSVIFNDESSFILSGTVLIAKTSDFNNGDSCKANNVAVCYVNVGSSRLTKECINTTADGKYSIVVAMRSYIEVWPEHSVGTVGSTFTPSSMMFNMSKDTEAAAFYLQPQGKLRIRAAGSKCLFSIGTHNFTLQARSYESCGYTRTNFQVVGRDPLVLTELPALDYEVTYLLADSNDPGLYTSAMIEQYMQEAYPTDSNQFSLKHVVEDSLEFIYHSAGHIEIQKIGDQLPCTAASGDKFFTVSGSPSIKSYNVTIHAWEEYGSEKCGYAGELWWMDGVTSKSLVEKMGNTAYSSCLMNSSLMGTYGCKHTVDSDGVSPYTTVYASILPGDPNVWGDLTYPLQATLVATGKVTQSTVDVAVTGTIIDENTYSSEIPLDVPIMMVFDPPGDSSYAWMSSGKTVSFSSETTMEVSGSMSVSVGYEAGLSVDLNVCTGCIVSYVCETPFAFDVNSGITATAAASSGYTRTESKSTAVSIDQTIRTSASSDLTPPDSDVVVVGVSSIMRAQTKTVRFDKSTCQPELVYGFTLLRTVSGTAVYQIYDIVNTQIPTLQSDLAKLEANPPLPNATTKELIMYHNLRESYTAGVKMWQQVLLHHDTILSNSALRRPLSDANSVGCSQTAQSSGEFSCSGGMLGSNTLFFTGGGQEYEFVSSMTSSRTTGEGGFFGLSTEVSVWTEAGGSVGDVTFRESYSATGVVETAASTFVEETTETRTEIGFVLSDNNVGDKFGVRIEASKDYGTPIFFTESGRSKCPHERNTVPREKAAISIMPATMTDIPAGLPAIFTVRLTNQNEFDEEFDMGLSQVLTTNKGGLLIKAFGIQLANTLELEVTDPYLEFNIEVYRGVFGYDYEGVKLQLTSLCDDDAMTTEAEFNVHYLAPCPSITWTGDLATDDDIKFIVNKKSSSLLRVVVKNPQGPAVRWDDVSSFDQAVLQYREPGSRVWRTAMVNTTTSVIFEEDAAGLALAWVDVSLWTVEGYYDMRAVSKCTYTGSVVDPALKTFLSPTVSGLVDRTVPEMFGTFANPADGVWVPGDEISVTFVETLNCAIEDTSFDWGYRVTNNAGGIAFFGNEYLDLICDNNKLYFAFSSLTDYSRLIGNKVTVFVKNPSDPAGNVNEIPISWQFTIPSFNDDQLVVRVSGLFLEGLSINEYIAVHPNSLTWQEAIIEDMLALDPTANVENMTIQQTSTGILIGFDIAPTTQTGASSPLEVLQQLNTAITNGTTSGSSYGSASRGLMSTRLVVLYNTPPQTAVSSSSFSSSSSIPAAVIDDLSSSSPIQQPTTVSSSSPTIIDSSSPTPPQVISVSNSESTIVSEAPAEEDKPISATLIAVITGIVVVIIVCAALAIAVALAVFFVNRTLAKQKQKPTEEQQTMLHPDPTPAPPQSPPPPPPASEATEAAVMAPAVTTTAAAAEPTKKHKKHKKHDDAVELDQV